ncbi:MAG: hypothetical protein KDA71_22020, partial [Planctomycetales bacterium]|nr:hypothetical protein [Planctomycetales bacterium]
MFNLWNLWRRKTESSSLPPTQPEPPARDADRWTALANRRSTRNRQLLLVDLEERLMFSASQIAAALTEDVATAANAPSDSPADSADNSGSPTQPLADSSGEGNTNHTL